MSSAILDWVKENMYFWFGPMWIVKYGGLAAGVACAMAVSLPFDNVATRLHTMRPLPNGQYPYEGTMDCFSKILKYECNFEKQSNIGAFYSGGQPYFLRLMLIALSSSICLDYYHASDKVSEFWQPARYHYQSGIDYDIHNPYTDGFNKAMVTNWQAKGGFKAVHPRASEGKSHFTFV